MALAIENQFQINAGMEKMARGNLIRFMPKTFDGKADEGKASHLTNISML